MSYFLQRADNPEQWEEVDAFVFAHREEAIMELTGLAIGKKRYSGNWAIHDGPRTAVWLNGNAERSNSRILGIVCRLLNVAAVSGNVVGGWCQSPDFIPFEGKGRQAAYLHQKGGDNFVAKKKAA